jgi:hypothetical protein
MNENFFVNQVEYTGSDSIDDATIQNCPKRSDMPKCFVAAAALGAAILLAGCNADIEPRGAFSTKEMLVTSGSLYSTFAACLLPGDQPAITNSYASPAGGCRLR